MSTPLSGVRLQLWVVAPEMTLLRVTVATWMSSVAMPHLPQAAAMWGTLRNQACLLCRLLTPSVPSEVVWPLI